MWKKRAGNNVPLIEIIIKVVSVLIYSVTLRMRCAAMDRDKFASIAFKCRGLFWTLLAVGVLVFPGSFSWWRYLAAMVLIVAGQSLRFWAAGYIPKYRTEVIGAPELVTSGPYAYIRNPLYAGNFLLGLGWALMAGFGWCLFFIAAFICLYSLVIIPAEERFLEGKFGEQYVKYKENTNALFPNFFSDKKESNKQFDFNVAFAAEKYSIRMHLLVTVLLTARLWFAK